MMEFCIVCYEKKCKVRGLTSQQFDHFCEGFGFSRSFLTEEQTVDAEFSFVPAGPYFDLHQEGQGSVLAQPLELLYEILRGRIASLVSSTSSGLLFLRGEAVCEPAGGALLLVGPSLTGKSRLAQSWVEKGATHWAREMIVLDPNGQALPFPSPDVPSQGIVVEGVGLIHYDSQAHWQPEMLTAGQATLALLPHVISTVEVPVQLGYLGKLCGSAAWRCRGGRPDDLPLEDVLAAFRTPHL